MKHLGRFCCEGNEIQREMLELLTSRWSSGTAAARLIRVTGGDKTMSFTDTSFFFPVTNKAHTRDVKPL